MRKLSTLISLGLFALTAHAAQTPLRMPIVNDDYAAARAEAQQRHVPIFVEAWAPW
jgi:hypothetical protein